MGRRPEEFPDSLPGPAPGAGRDDGLDDLSFAPGSSECGVVEEEFLGGAFVLLAGLAATDLMLLVPAGPLSSDAETASWVYRETDGNPFLAVEIIDHIDETGSRDGVPSG